MTCDAVKTVFQKDMVGEASLEVGNRHIRIYSGAHKHQKVELIYFPIAD